MPDVLRSEETLPLTGSLRPWEGATVEVFVHAAALIGLPRSVGEIYGFLFCSSEPQTFDAIMDGLGISKGSVSQGLKLLRQVGAVKVVYLEGSRRDHYKPELGIKRLVSGFLRDQLQPHLDSAEKRLGRARSLAAAEPDPILRNHALNRLQTLEVWQRRVLQLLPLAATVLGGIAPFFNAADKGREDLSERPLV